jgi:rhodanese-related sulfurtransferase
MVDRIGAASLKARIAGGGEIAVLDLREEGAFAAGHLLLARSVPASRLEIGFADLVPRRATPIALIDAGDGVAERTAQRLARFGYADTSVLDGGIAAWRDAGFAVFGGINVPSKAFGEWIEERCHTPSISAAELRAKQESGEDLVILDSRPFAEYERMNIPGGIDVPGAELAYRVHDIAPSPGTLVVVNCAGRTRSIIGAQSLINAGIANRVVALRNGTMGWELAGFAPERGAQRRAPEVSAQGLSNARAAADRVARRFGVTTIDCAALDHLRGEAGARSLYVFDVRSPEEYAAGRLPGSISAPGGQLVQATDRYVGTLGARFVLVDDTGVRATMTASWLLQMGWREVFVLAGAFDSVELERGARPVPVLGLDEARPATLAPGDLHAMLARGEAAVVDLGTSLAYRQGHVPGAWWAVRARLAQGLAKVAAGPLVLTSGDGVLARLAAAEAAATGRAVRVLAGGTEAWRAAGLPLEAGAARMADAPDDVWLRPYDRAAGVKAAMQEYLDWEQGLVAQVERDGTMRFAEFPVSR